jgi:manganese/zinc/iron transport system permease protein
MVMVSLVAVGAFDAVGSILVIAFFIIPPAAAYLLTDRLPVMLAISALIGAAGAFFGYDLARGSLFGLLQIGDGIAWLNRIFGLGWDERWDSSISASMVLMIFFFFVLSWIFSPKYGLVSTLLRRNRQQRRFSQQVVLGHIYNHRGSAVEMQELKVATLHKHFRWSAAEMRRVLAGLRSAHLVQIQGDVVQLTERGEGRIHEFRQQNLVNETAGK